MRLFFFLWILPAYAAFNLTWGTPAINLDPNPPFGDTDGNAMIAIDPKGNAVATWSRTSGQGASEDIWAAQYNHSLKTWTGAVKISGGGSAANPRVAMDPLGNAILVWEEGFPTQIMSRTLNTEGVWIPDVSRDPLLVQKSLYAQTAPQIGIDASGQALAIWMEYFDRHTHILSARKPFQLPWTDLGEISTSSKEAILTPTKALALNAAGHGMAVWIELNGSFSEVLAAEYEEGNPENKWSSPISISAEEGKNPQAPIVGIDEQNQAVIVWTQDQIIQCKTLIHHTLSSRLTVSDPAYPSQHPDIGVDSAGNAVVVFERSNGMHKFIAASSLPFNTGAWSAPIDISGPSPATSTLAGYPVLALNALGDGVAIWKEDNGTHRIVHGAGYALGTWSFIKPLSSENDDSGAPIPSYDIAVSVNTAGNILAIWPENSSGTGSLQIKATAGVGLANAAPPPPAADPQTVFSGIASGKQIVHKFPAHSDFINILTWTSSPDAAYYRVYRDNFSSLIGTSPTNRYEDHQRTPKKQETYLITAVDRHGQESSPITLVVTPTGK